MEPVPQSNDMQIADSRSETLAVMIVDHGSRREESNQMLLDVVQLFRNETSYDIVEPAHMELAAPSIADAFNTCVERGADRIVVLPYFLSPGRHWQDDIPELAAAAAQKHPGVSYCVASPIGLHPLVARILEDRLTECLQQS